MLAYFFAPLTVLCEVLLLERGEATLTHKTECFLMLQTLHSNDLFTLCMIYLCVCIVL